MGGVRAGDSSSERPSIVGPSPIYFVPITYAHFNSTSLSGGRGRLSSSIIGRYVNCNSTTKQFEFYDVVPYETRDVTREIFFIFLLKSYKNHRYCNGNYYKP